MTVFIGKATTYDLTVGVKINMDEVIYTNSPMDVPMLGGIGSDGLSVISTVPLDEVDAFWMEEDLLTPRSSLAASLTTAGTILTVGAGERAKFSTGDTWRPVEALSDEVIRIASYGTTAETLIITRAWAGTAVDYDTGVILMGLGTALAEGSDPENARHKDRAQKTNNTQIFGPTKVQMSGTEQVVSKYGVSSEFARQVFNRTVEMNQHREQVAVYGRAVNSATLKIRTTGGLDNFITRVNSTATQLTVASVQAMQQLGYNAGGMFDRLMANPGSLGDLNEVADTARVQQVIDDPRRGRVPVMTIWTEFGPLSVVRNRWVHPFHAFAFRRDGVVRRPLRPMQIERLAKTGDSDSVQLVGEEAYEVKGIAHMGKWNNLTAYTAA